MTPAEIILQQLGGNKFAAMTGAKNFVQDKTFLMFSIPKSKKINKVRITIADNDLYDLEFFNVGRRNFELVQKVTGVYAEDLQKIFTNHTGLLTRL